VVRHVGQQPGGAGLRRRRQQDGLLQRDVAAAWLNVLAGNDPGTPDGAFDDVADWIQAGLEWLDATPQPVRANSAAWKTDVGGLQAGSEIHNELDAWNNEGDMFL